MGRVYLARSPGGRTVAVKVIRANLAEDAGFRARFAREVSAARKVGGLFTAAVVDADVDGPVPWLVTAYVPGTSLSDAVERQGPLPENSVLALAAGLAEGLIAIHAAGVIHRDLKPSNVLLAQDGPRIIDFGISSAAGATSLTGTGFMIGSPGFMSPEQAEGLTVGPASDIFSLAGVLIYAARGEGPFGSGDTAALLYRVVHGKPNTDNVPENLRPLIKRSLSRDPKRRPTATQFLTDLSAAYPAAADLSNWLPAQILGENTARSAPSEASLHPPGGSGAGGSFAGGSFAGGSVAGQPSMADPVAPAADPVAPAADPVAPMGMAAAAREAEPGPAAAPRTARPPAPRCPPRRRPRRPRIPPARRVIRRRRGRRPRGTPGRRATRASRAIPPSRATKVSRVSRATPVSRTTRRASRATPVSRATPASRATRAIPALRDTRARRATRVSSSTPSRRATRPVSAPRGIRPRGGGAASSRAAPSPAFPGSGTRRAAGPPVLLPGRRASGRSG